MEIVLSAHSELPICELIYDRIKNQIIDQSLISRDEMLSVRGLAKEFKISLITIKTAYELLTLEGFLISIKGKYTYFTEINQFLFEKK